MALKNDGREVFRSFDEPLSLEVLAEAERRMKAKKEYLEDVKNEYRLLELDAFNLYRSHVNYIRFASETIREARNWMTMLEKKEDMDGNKLDRRKSYSEKFHYELLVERMKQYLEVPITITRIADWNFGEGWHIGFESHNHKWQLSIPVVYGVNFESFQHYGNSCFKLILHNADVDYVCEYVGSTFIEEDLKDIMAEGIKKYCGEESNT